ncbi:hypothetical protein GCM10023160_11350 [Brachybacterium paraconglomeratum]|uniref:hypothetical protein n=1 Tax=Brachybacterium paraconglomeratum TaxID=173362 RepID=UPI0031E67EA4
MRTHSTMRAATLVTTAVLALGASFASANAHVGSSAPTETTVASTASNKYEQSLTAEDGTVVTFKLDVESQTLTVSNSRGDREVVSVPDEVIEDLTSNAATSPGTISVQRVSVETCKNILSAAGYANGIVWTLATIAAAPTVAGSLVGAGAGLITSAMLTEAGRLCK